MRRLLLLCVLLLAGCTIMPDDPEQMPEGYNDPKEDLVAHLKDNPDDLDSHADLLRMQIKDGDVEGANTTVSHALKHNGGDYRAHLLAAQLHRWQADLISAEKSLLVARDLAPEALEPRVALSSLYNQTYLEAEELTQRRVAVDLAGAEFRSEFVLDYAYAAAALGNDAQAGEFANALLAEDDAPPDRLSRAHVLLCEIALRADRETDAVNQLLEALKHQPDYDGLQQYAARMVTAVSDAKALAPVFDKTLETQDRVELRWAALFGKWMLAVKASDDPLDDEVNNWYRRLDAVSPSHPDTLSRYYQLLKLDPRRDDEAEATLEQLREIEFGEPPAVSSLTSLLRLWRAEDALRLNAPNITLSELTQLEVREPDVEGLRIMRTMALFKARENDKCLENLDNWFEQSEEPDEFLVAMRWWILLRDGRSLEVLAELREREKEPTNASLWIEAVARFHVYRKGGDVPEEG
ncbi:MAG: hypothetical protein K8I27_15975 [Planctomycetes bacterium]|nr:hypothetical protein [Planctomycetota bacterium]